MSNEILVLGGTGKTGKRVAERLQRLNLPVRLGSRNANPKFDWKNQATWADALKNVSKVYITFQPDVAVPGAVETIRLFAEEAIKSRVQKFVLLSGRGEVEAQHCEQVIIHSGAEWTIVSSSWFMQNFSESLFLDPILAGHVALPVGNVGEPFIDADDIADVVVAALTDEKHHGQVYEVTGPRLLTFKQVIDEISNATGNQINYAQITIEQYSTMLTEYQVPDDYIKLITYLFTQVLDGRNCKLSDGVEKALGRKSTDFSEYLKRTVTTGVWTNQATV